MSILSVDVGIKNLALCLLSREKEIFLWEVLNISCEDTLAESSSASNVATHMKCSLCKNNAKYRKNETLFCLRHAKESAYQLPTKDLLPSKLEKMKLPELKGVLDTYSLDATTLEKTKKRKADYLQVITSNLLDPLEGSSSSSPKQMKASEISLVEIARIMTKKLDRLLESHLERIDTVIIENQISPIATRMTSIQGMLTQYFIMKKPTQPIHYISAKNKLKEFNVEKDCYADRKKSGIEIVKTELTLPASCNSRWNELFLRHKKKDDLADCYLQGVWYLGQQHSPASAITPAPTAAEESI
jgi:hypothetical protein